MVRTDAKGCICGAPRPRGCFITQIDPIGLWCKCGRRWLLLSESTMRLIPDAEAFGAGRVVCSSREQAEQLREIADERLPIVDESDWWEKNKHLIA